MARKTPFATFNFQTIRNNNTSNMIRKTYGVSGLMDWTTQIKVGKATLNVHFVGGALTAYGVTPAKYSTANPIFQNVIENSDYFKSGRIQLLDTMEVADDAAAKARKARAAKAADAVVNPATPATPVTEPTTPVVEQPIAGNDEQPCGDDAPQGSGDGESEGDADNKVEVADKNEAIEYLKEHFADKNYTATQLRTKTAFEAACKDCGVEFVFTA